MDPDPDADARAAMVSGRNGMLAETNVADRGEGDDDVAEMLGECCGDVKAEDGKRWGEFGVGNEMNESIVLAVGMLEAIPGTVVKGGQYKDSSGIGPGPCSTELPLTVGAMIGSHSPGRVWLPWLPCGCSAARIVLSTCRAASRMLRNIRSSWNDSSVWSISSARDASSTNAAKAGSAREAAKSSSK